MRSEVVKCQDSRYNHNQTGYCILYYMYIKYNDTNLVVLKAGKHSYIILDSEDGNDIGHLFDMSIESIEDVEFEKVPRDYKVELRND